MKTRFWLIISAFLLGFLLMSCGTVESRTEASLSKDLTAFDLKYSQLGTLKINAVVSVQLDSTRFSDQEIETQLQMILNESEPYLYVRSTSEGLWETQSGFVIETLHGHLVQRTFSAQNVSTELVNDVVVDALFGEAFGDAETVLPFPDDATISRDDPGIYTVTFPMGALLEAEPYAELLESIGMEEETLDVLRDCPVVMEFEFRNEHQEVLINFTLVSTEWIPYYTTTISLSYHLITLDYLTKISFSDPRYVQFLPRDPELADLYSFDADSGTQTYSVMAEASQGNYMAFPLEPGFYRVSGVVVRMSDSEGNAIKGTVAYPVATEGIYLMQIVTGQSSAYEIAVTRYPIEEVGTPQNPIYSEGVSSGTLSDSTRYLMFPPADEISTLSIHVTSTSGGEITYHYGNASQTLIAGGTIHQTVTVGNPIIFSLSGTGEYSIAVTRNPT